MSVRSLGVGQAKSEVGEEVYLSFEQVEQPENPRSRNKKSTLTGRAEYDQAHRRGYVQEYTENASKKWSFTEQYVHACTYLSWVSVFMDICLTHKNKNPE